MISVEARSYPTNSNEIHSVGNSHDEGHRSRILILFAIAVNRLSCDVGAEHLARERGYLTVTQPFLAPLVDLFQLVRIEFLRATDRLAVFASVLDHLVGVLAGEIGPKLVE